MATRFQYRRQVEAEILKSEPILGAQLRAVADKGAKEAQQLARREAYLTGDYAKSISGQVGVEDGKVRGRVVAEDFKAGWIEFGTSDPRRPARAILARGVQATGIEFKKTGRR